LAWENQEELFIPKMTKRRYFLYWQIGTGCRLNQRELKKGTGKAFGKITS